MHSAEELTSSSFAIRLAGRPASLWDVFSGLGEHDRLGVVVRRPCGAVGASALILAAVTAFYDIQRERCDDFFVYPDYFLFHVGRPLGDHDMLDIWPRHKEVVVAAAAEEILRAINDRAGSSSRTKNPEARTSSANRSRAPAVGSSARLPTPGAAGWRTPT